MNKRSNSIAAALLAAFALGLTGCGAGDEATAQPEAPVSSPAPATSTAAAELPVRPETVLLDMDKTAMDPEVIAAYANPNIDQEISAAAEEFIKVGLSFPELQRGSHTPSEADVAVMEPLRPLVDKAGYWDPFVKSVTEGNPAGFFPPYLSNMDANGPEAAADDSGVSFIFKNDDMKIVYEPFENGEPGVKVENIKVRLMYTTVDGAVANIDRNLYLYFYLAPDGTWDAWRFSGSDSPELVINKTQEELDALPAL